MKKRIFILLLTFLVVHTSLGQKQDQNFLKLWKRKIVSNFLAFSLYSEYREEKEKKEKKSKE